jgi:uncharacterized protein
MANKENRFDRRSFIKSASAAGFASVFAAKAAANQKAAPPKIGDNIKAPQNPKIPKRTLGKTGIEIAILGLGGMFDIPNNQIVLKKSIDWGVTFWDTSNTYEGGNSELGIGQYIEKNPKIRKDLFIVSKASGAKNVQQIEEKLQLSLKRMKTDYVDLYYGVHGLSNPKDLTEDLRKWAEDAKKRGVIKHFGFSTHSNMADCLAAAAKLDWIDVIMPKYNFRDIENEKMQAAVNACQKAGIGLIAMKTQGGGPVKLASELDKKMTGRFLKRGFTKHQVKLQAVWQDERFASICSQMPSVKLLQSNVLAALDKTELAKDDIDYLKGFARQTCSGYCAGCSDICAATVQDMPHVADVMRYLMYHRDYNETARAKASFSRLPSHVRRNIANFDYSKAEMHCPQNLPIAKLMKEASKLLA